MGPVNKRGCYVELYGRSMVGMGGLFRGSCRAVSTNSVPSEGVGGVLIWCCLIVLYVKVVGGCWCW